MRLREEEIPTIVTDWEMPDIDGIELCKRIRSEFPDEYKYILVATGNTEADAISRIFEAGADDFMTKPVKDVVLRSRLFSGLRIVELHDRLKWKNGELVEKKRIIDQAYADIEKDLFVAEEVQRNYVPKSYERIGDIEFAGLYRPAQFLGGDMLNYFRLNDNTLGVFSIDVSGHGIASALLSIAAAEKLISGGAASALLYEPMNGDTPLAERPVRDPADVVADLNALFSTIDTGHYFTIDYAVLDLQNAEMRYCQAGHPQILVVNRDGRCTFIGEGGLPVGLIDHAAFENQRFALAPGDRVYLYSDGITECPSPDGAFFGEERLARLLSSMADAPLQKGVERVNAAVDEWRGDLAHADDISLISFEIASSPVQSSPAKKELYHVD